MPVNERVLIFKVCMSLFGERYRAFCRILCCILALHLLNYSIDPQDPEFVPEDISFNEIESIAELVAEVFGLEAFFEDFDENDTDGADHADSFQFFCSPRSSVAITHPADFILDHKWSKAGDNRHVSPFLGIFVPPPKG